VNPPQAGQCRARAHLKKHLMKDDKELFVLIWVGRWRDRQLGVANLEGRRRRVGVERHDHDMETKQRAGTSIGD
jgi:hypothetical protein